MAKISSGGVYAGESYKKRPGVHSKNNSSNHKQSKNYKKKYKGQGK